MKSLSVLTLLLMTSVGRPIEAADFFQMTVPNAVAKVSKQAQQLRLQNKPEEARALLEPIAKENPSYFLVHYNLGLTYGAQGDWNAAISELEHAKRINMQEGLSEPTIYNSLGWAYLQSGSYDKALAEFQLAQVPGTFDKLNAESQRKVLNNTGLTLAYLGQPAKAAQYYAKAKEIR